MPNIRKLPEALPDKYVEFNSEKINCVFLGNLYHKIREPEYLFNLFSKINSNAVLYVVGELIGISKSYIEEWVDKLDGKLVYCGRVSQEEALAIISKADVLVNIGNVTTNQCPSKVIDYISTGKPIINIAKIDDCTSEVCLRKYPNKVLLNEKEKITDEVVLGVNRFLCANKNGSCIPFERIQELYNDYTMDKMIDEFLVNSE